MVIRSPPSQWATPQPRDVSHQPDREGLVHVPEYQKPVELTLRDVLGAASEVFLRYSVETAHTSSGANPV